MTWIRLTVIKIEVKADNVTSVKVDPLYIIEDCGVDHSAPEFNRMENYEQTGSA